MSRAFRRVLILSALTGFAIAPAVANAAECTSNPPTATVTTVHMSKQAVSGHPLTFTAQVAPEKKGSPTKDGQSGHKGGKGKGDQSGRGPKHHKKHRPVKRTKGSTHGGKGKGHKRVHETGEVTFTVDGKALAPVKVQRNRAVERLELPQGKHTVTAAYSGDLNYAPSSANPLTFTVK